MLFDCLYYDCDLSLDITIIFFNINILFIPLYSLPPYRQSFGWNLLSVDYLSRLRTSPTGLTNKVPRHDSTWR